MRIALVYLGRRGAGLPISYELACHLAGADEVLAVLSTTAATWADWQSLNIDILSTSTYQSTVQALWSWLTRHRIRHLAEKISTWKPDILFFPMFYTWNPFLQFELSCIPSVIAVHDPRPHPGITDWLFQWMEDRSIQMARRCLVFSHSLAPELAKRGCDPCHIDVISLGTFDYSRWRGTNEKRSRSDPIPTLLFFGRITSYKGLDILLEAYQQIYQQHRTRLLIVGEGDLRPYRSLLSNKQDIEIINRWVAEDEIPSIFEQADMLILPYTSASQSGVVPIAAGFSLPVIATRTGGIPEQIEDGKSGLLVAPGSVEQLVMAIKRLLDKPALRESLGARLRSVFQSQNSWQGTADKVRQSLATALDLKDD